MGSTKLNGEDCAIAGKCDATKVYEYDPRRDIWRPVAFERDSVRALSSPVAVYLPSSDEIVAFDANSARRTGPVVNTTLHRLKLPQKGPTELLSNPSCEDFDRTSAVTNFPGLRTKGNNPETAFGLPNQPKCDSKSSGCWSIEKGSLFCTQPNVSRTSVVNSSRMLSTSIESTSATSAPSGEYVFDLHSDPSSKGKACQRFAVDTSVGLFNPGLTLQVTGFVATDVNASFEERSLLWRHNAPPKCLLCAAFEFIDYIIAK